MKRFTLLTMLFALLSVTAFAQTDSYTGGGEEQKSEIFRLTLNEEYAVGDVNHDNAVTITDAVLMVEYLLCGEAPNFFMENADIDGDNNITFTDAFNLVDIILNGFEEH